MRVRRLSGLQWQTCWHPKLSQNRTMIQDNCRELIPDSVRLTRLPWWTVLVIFPILWHFQSWPASSECLMSHRLDFKRNFCINRLNCHQRGEENYLRSMRFCCSYGINTLCVRNTSEKTSRKFSWFSEILACSTICSDFSTKEISFVQPVWFSKKILENLKFKF